MVSAVLASLLQSYLGRYLELSDASISVGSEVRLKNVKLRESAFSDLGLPIKVVHGKVSHLVIRIPWFSLFAKSTTIEIEGVHLLVVPSTSVSYDEEKEDKVQQEAKQKRLLLAEEAKRISEEVKNEADSSGAAQDSFVERLVANIIKNLEVTVRKVHIRYEDGQTNSSGFPFAAGATLQEVTMKTTNSDEPDDGKIKLKIFEKQVKLDSFAIYWKPKASLFSNDTRLGTDDDVIDKMFDSNIGSLEAPNLKLMYLVGPISSEAGMKWCPSPETQDYSVPRIDLSIHMRELGLSLSKYQYHDFVLLLQAVEYMTRASKFRRYKSRHGLENLPNFQGFLRKLWKFAFDCVYEEEVIRRRNNWSWEHMKKHVATCKSYREAYKLKLSTKKLSQAQKDDLDRFECILDEVNIRIQRQLAEREVKKKIEDDKKSSSNSGGGFLGWFWSGSKKSSGDGAAEVFNVKKLEEALSPDEKKQLYEAIDYQESAHLGIYPKSFVAHKLSFCLDQMSVFIRDEEMRESEVLKLSLQKVMCTLTQRPAAENSKLSMSMTSLTVTGWPAAGGKPGPVIVSTRSTGAYDKLLKLELENHPPSNPDGNLDDDMGCLYDQRIKLHSSPLEIIYDQRTFRQILAMFKTPDEINLSNLQQSAFAKLREYKESTALTLQYAIDTHNLIDVEIFLMSSYIVLPHGGTFTESCACTVANLGSLSVQSKPISAETRSLKDISLPQLTESFKLSLRDQVYDKFEVSLQNMQVLVALPNENWRSEIGKRRSPLFLLKPTTIKVQLQYCLITNDPELPLCKVNGNLDKLSVNIADYRLIKLVQIVDSLFDATPEEERTLHRAESDESMASALSSFANTGSFISNNIQLASNVLIAPQLHSQLSQSQESSNVQMTQFKVDFKIDKIDFSLSQLKKHSNEDEEIFNFLIHSIAVEAKLRTFDMTGNFTMGGMQCTHLLTSCPDGSPVYILDTSDGANESSIKDLLSLSYVDVKKNHPDFETLHESVLKRLDIKFRSVDITIHQDVITDLVDKVNKLVDEVSSKSKNLTQMNASQLAEQQQQKLQKPPEKPKVQKKALNKRLLALKRLGESSAISRVGGTKARNNKSGDSEVVQVQIIATLDSASIKLMTSKVPDLITMRVMKLKATFDQTESSKEVTAKLEKFEVFDDAGVASPHGTLYEKIAENVDADQEVFDVKVVVFDNVDPDHKSDPDIVDIFVALKLGRIRFVFLMKFLNDFLRFLEPFSAAKEMVVEKANDAFEGATKSVIDAYVSCTRVQLDVLLEAPLIIVPVHSRSRTTFMADLGTLKLTNSFAMENGRMFDKMHFTLRELKLTRAKLDESKSSNTVLSQCPIIKPITFELDIRRNMNGTQKKEDPAEICISGTLYKIEAEISKGDYSVLMALITENFSEKGSFESDMKPAPAGDRNALSLPVKSKYAGSRTSLASSSSLLEAMKSSEKDPEAKGVEFHFKFRGLQVEIYSGDTSLDVPEDKRNPAHSLAKIGAEFLSVNGCLRISSAIEAKACLENLVLDDSRQRDPKTLNPNQIVRLMEAKDPQKQGKTKMIEVEYKKDASGDQNVEVTVYSFILVGSVSYLLEIGNFFVLDNKMKYEWKSEEPEVTEAVNKMSIFLKIEEPDIFLVENLEDVNSDALMFNTELQLKMLAVGTNFSIWAKLENIRCHTCRFNTVHREETMAQILRPCTLAFTAGQQEANSMRVNVNFGDLCFNVSPRSIQIIQNSLQAFIDSLGSEESVEQSALEKVEDFSGIWETKPFTENQFWFLKPDDPIEGTELLQPDSGLSTHGSLAPGREQAIININNLVIQIESGSGNNTIPLLLLESKFNCDVKDWSGPRMSVMGNMELEMAYYNAKLALWEPVVEPIIHETSDGSLVKKRWDLFITLQKSSAHDFASAMVSPNFDEQDGFVLPQDMPPSMSLSLQSRDPLEITVTKTFIGVINTLAQSFTEASDQAKKDKKMVPSAPIIVKNYLGIPITVMLDNRSFKYYVQGSKPGVTSEINLLHDSEVNLVLYRDRNHKDIGDYVSPLQEQTEQAEATLRIKVEGQKGIFELPVSKADRRFFPFPFRGDEMGDQHGLVSEIWVDNGSKFISLRSIVQIKNHFSAGIIIYSVNEHDVYKKLAHVKPDQVFNVPLSDVYKPPYKYHFQVEGEGESLSLEWFCWKQLKDSSSQSQQIQCTNTKGRPDQYLNVDGTMERIFLEKTGCLSSSTFVLDIRPLFVLKNCLPATLHYTVGEVKGYIEPGQSGYLHGIRYGYTILCLKIFEFRETDWTSEQKLEAEMPELSSWRFVGVADTQQNPAKMDLGVNSVTSRGTLVISIFAPFWMVNKTGRNLTYKGQDNQNVIYHPKELEQVPMMFSYTGKSFLQKKKASVRVDDSRWSDPFTLDTIEDAGKVTCKRQTPTSSQKVDPFSLGVNINMSKSSLTKIITFTPFFMVQNNLQESITLWEQEAENSDDTIIVSPGQTSPFWPTHGAERVIAKVGQFSSVPFTMRAGHTSLLALGKREGAIFVECQTSVSETTVTIRPYKRGLAPVQLVNHTKGFMIEYCEEDQSENLFLAPGECVYFSWSKPLGSRSLVWCVAGHNEKFKNPLLSDGEGLVEVFKGRILSWVSFLDGMQRVLLFTENHNLCYELAHTTGEKERIDFEISISIYGIGLSVVNNNCYLNGGGNHEIIYMSICSSDIVWETRRPGKTRYKPLTQYQCEAIEKDFQFYQRKKSIGNSVNEERHISTDTSKPDIVVNYEEMTMSQPHAGRLRRQFQKGLWLQVRSSAHQRQIHAKIFRVQIDNQMSNCLFPVILAPVPPPKSVVADSIPKPFMELSILEFMSPEHTNLRQFKYVGALVQELHIKIDQGLLNAIIELMEEEEILDVDINEFLKEDLALAQRDLGAVATLKGSQGQKDFYDNLHLSPLKVHVSFSLTSYKSSPSHSRRSNFLGLFLHSLGVTVTDTDDIVFRLAYFERNHCFYSTQDLFTEMIRHYTSQAIKQAYVVILGLDVIGNPFGLVVGVSRSVEDLFYEPFQGGVEGPAEFAEGLVIGVRSVFSGVVGGAAGTVSRITGALGSGLASLTFDEKFQSKRREAIKKRGKQNFGESIARGGKGLFMGIVDGVTGVATKPIEGAKEDGVGGFFKGVGKGVVGLVARPTGGIIDFASGTFDSVKRATEVVAEVNRARPPRFLKQDGVVRYYNRKEALGCRMLTQLDKGRYAETDVYVTHQDIEADKDSVFMVSNKRLLFLTYQSILGTWSIEWEFEFHEIIGPPPCGVDDATGKWYIIIKPEEKKRKVFGLFGGGETGKKIYVKSREETRQLARIIEDLRTQIQS